MKRVIYFLLAMLILAAMCLCGLSCNPEKKAQRERDKIVNKAQNDAALKKQLWPVIREAFPCVNDTTPPIIKHDTTHSVIPVPILTKEGDSTIRALRSQLTVKDSACYEDIDRAIQAIRENAIVLPYGYDQTFNNGVRLTVSITKGIEVSVPKADTTRYVKDKEEIKLWNDSTLFYKGQSSSYYTQWKQQEKQTAAVAAEFSVFKKKLWGILIAIAVLFVAYFVIKLKGGAILTFIKSIIKIGS